MKRNEFEAVKEAVKHLQDAWNDPEKLQYRLDELGKVVQTTEGNGTMEDPYKGWKVGSSVEAGKWYITEDEYIWEAIKSGMPSSTTDREYFDVVGI